MIAESSKNFMPPAKIRNAVYNVAMTAIFRSRLRSCGLVSYVSPRRAISSPYPATSRYGISDIELHSFSASVNASSENSVLITKSWTMTLLSHRAAAGTLFWFSVAKILGMSSVFAALNRTSAAIICHAR